MNNNLNMTSAAFLACLADACTKREAARIRWERFTGQSKRDAAEDLEFWSNRVAYLKAAYR